MSRATRLNSGEDHEFPGIASDDHARIPAAFSAHRKTSATEGLPLEPDTLDVRLAVVEANRGIRTRTVRTHRERLLQICDFPARDDLEAYGGRKMDGVGGRGATDHSQPVRRMRIEMFDDPMPEPPTDR